MAEAEEAPEAQSGITEEVLGAARSLLHRSVELQRWSGHLDWSKRLTAEGVLKSPGLMQAFSSVSRIDFLPESEKSDEGYDQPIPIGYRQTNSQPSLVAEMLELLQPQEGQAVLDVGSGSGWTTGLLAAAVQERGRVVGVERLSELVELSKANLSAYDFAWSKVEHTPSGLGFAAEAPYDRILVSAHMLEEWVPELTAQLSEDSGIMVAPIATPANHGSRDFNQNIVVITKNGDEIDQKVAVKEVGFVPLVHTEMSTT